MRTNTALYYVTLLLTALGAINWGLVGLADINLVKTLFGTMPAVERAIYTLIGASGIIYPLLAINEHECHNRDHHTRGDRDRDSRDHVTR